MGHASIWGSPARDSQMQGSSTELQGLLKTLLQKSSSSNSFPPLSKSAAVPVSCESDTNRGCRNPDFLKSIRVVFLGFIYLLGGVYWVLEVFLDFFGGVSGFWVFCITYFGISMGF